MPSRAFFALGLTLIAATPLSRRAEAQSRVQLDVIVPAGTLTATQAPSVVGKNLLADPTTRELLRNGFPTKLHFKLELWKEKGLFNDVEGSTEWEVLVQYDPAAQVYRAVRRNGKQLEDFGSFATLTSAEEPLTRPYRVPLRPRSQGGRYYYNVFLDVTTLDVSDLDELQRWLRGEFQPAVRGKTNPASALKNGIGTLLSRLLGGERRHYEQRSETFTAG
ncbi:MAG: hypothetical protein ACJ796_21310 [Gemmatimonadaceae bacterium]